MKMTQEVTVDVNREIFSDGKFRKISTLDTSSIDDLISPTRAYIHTYVRDEISNSTLPKDAFTHTAESRVY